MDIQLISNASQLDDKVFSNLYEILTKNKMQFNTALLTEVNLVFVLKDPKRLFTINKCKDNYKLKMEGEDGFEYTVNVNQIEDLIELLVKRQAI